jgi:16S rRNA (cytidine1402-2'-O)-methyltransferase
VSGQGTLYVVATPIGNLQDMTLRAVETLRRVLHVAAEDTRRTRALLGHLGLQGKELHSLHAHSPATDIERLAAILQRGEDIALASDAGTPLVSDPGGALVRAAIQGGARVVPVPGPSAVLAALVVSGLSTDEGFRFVGFLPRSGPERREAILRISATSEPVVLFESPLRVEVTLRDLADATPARAACVARELTKVHEEATRGTLSELANVAREYRGEVAIVLGGHRPEARQEEVDDAAVDARIQIELARGIHAKAIAARVAAWSGRPRRDLYARVIAMKGR